MASSKDIAAMGAAAGPPEEGALAPEAVAVLAIQLVRLFKEHKVLRLGAIRRLLSREGTDEALRCAVEAASDATLHAAIMKIGKYEFIRGRYVFKRAGPIQTVRPLRAIILELLKQTEEPVTLDDVIAAAKTRGGALRRRRLHQSHVGAGYWLAGRMGPQEWAGV